MNKLSKLCVYIMTAIVALTVLHIWQNIGFERIRPKWLSGGEAETIFKVGFLPVT
jgi:hypothetical protein